MAAGDITLTTPRTVQVTGLEPVELRIQLTIPRLELDMAERGTGQLHRISVQNGQSTGLAFADGAFSAPQVSTPTGFATAYAGMRNGGKRGLMLALVSLGLLNLSGGTVDE